jgi:hypothetical protein
VNQARTSLTPQRTDIPDTSFTRQRLPIVRFAQLDAHAAFGAFGANEPKRFAVEVSESDRAEVHDPVFVVLGPNLDLLVGERMADEDALLAPSNAPVAVDAFRV